MHEAVDDIAVITQVLQGQQTAYALLVNKYQLYVFTLAMRYVNDRELAEELAQDVFLKAYRNLADFRGNSKFSTWLYTIVKTTCLSHLRRKDNGMIPMEQDDIVLLADNAGSTQPTDRLERRMEQQQINAALNQLQEEDAQVLTLFYLAEQTTEEIALILGLTISNVKVRLFRARKKLKEVLIPNPSR